MTSWAYVCISSAYYFFPFKIQFGVYLHSWLLLWKIRGEMLFRWCTLMTCSWFIFWTNCRSCLAHWCLHFIMFMKLEGSCCWWWGNGSYSVTMKKVLYAAKRVYSASNWWKKSQGDSPARFRSSFGEVFECAISFGCEWCFL